MTIDRLVPVGVLAVVLLCTGAPRALDIAFVAGGLLGRSLVGGGHVVGSEQSRDSGILLSGSLLSSLSLSVEKETPHHLLEVFIPLPRS